MRDCHGNLNKWQTGFSRTHNSLLLTQPPTSLQSSSPIYVWVLVRVVGTVGTVETVFFVRNETMSVRTSGSRFTSESCPTREKTWSTLVTRWHTVFLKITKYKGNRIRNCHIISNSFSTPSSVDCDKPLTFVCWKIWPPPNLIADFINLNRLSHFRWRSNLSDWVRTVN